MIPKFIIHLLSGGLDSVTMLYDLREQGHKVHCLLFDYGQPHRQELGFARMHCMSIGEPFSEIKLPPLGGLTDESWIVPNRNAVLISHAVSLAVRSNAGTVTIGCNADDAENFPDCRKAFLDAMNGAVRVAGYSVEICAPFLEVPKWQVVAKARILGVELWKTWTCYRGGDVPCGKCPSCEKLRAAIRLENEKREMRPL